MAVSFNNIPTTTRTPGVYVEIDNSRALKSLAANPHKALILGQKIIGEGSVGNAILKEITSENVANGYFGSGSILAKMCNKFKQNNPNTELYAIALSGGTVQASARIRFSALLSFNAGIVSTNNEVMHLMVDGYPFNVTLTSNWSSHDVASATWTAMRAVSTIGVIPSIGSAAVSAAVSGILFLSAVCSGVQGNYLDVRFNYFAGESFPTCFDSNLAASYLSAFEGGVGSPDLGDAWGIIENEQYHYIIQPYVDSTNLTEIETELADRFKPLEDKQGHGFTCVRGTQASCTTLGNLRNSPHNTILGVYDSPNCPDEWAAALGAVAAFNLNNDPARPLHFLQLKGLYSPPTQNRFTRTERETLLYDGISTWIVDNGGNILIERLITTYQSNALGLSDASYLDVNTLATLSEIRYQYKARMANRFLVPRFKLADDTYPVQTGSYVATPNVVKQETISLFTLLRDRGLIENLDDFIDNLVVERDETDANRVNVLLPPDLINQFRILAGLIQFIL